MQDLRLALRTLRATPVVTAVAILSLALGIGANTAIFSIVNSLALRTLAAAEPQRLALVGGSRMSGARASFSYATFDQIRRYGQAFDGALAYSDCCDVASMTIAGEASRWRASSSAATSSRRSGSPRWPDGCSSPPTICRAAARRGRLP